MASQTRNANSSEQLADRGKLAAHLKVLCPARAKSSTSSGLFGNVLDVNAPPDSVPSTVMRHAFDPALVWMSGLNLSPFKPYFSTSRGAAFNVDSMLVLKALPSASVDLVLTSPPFALTRKKKYGNEPLERYLEWFTPFYLEIKRVLKPTDGFVLDIGGA